MSKQKSTLAPARLKFQKLHLEILQSIQSLQESLQAPVDPNVES